eukprot:9373496-Pyramimonas_sp.AAC.1
MPRPTRGARRFIEKANSTFSKKCTGRGMSTQKYAFLTELSDTRVDQARPSGRGRKQRQALARQRKT